MALTPLQKQTLADELVDVMERFQHEIDQHPDRYEALISEPTPRHLIIKLQPAHASAV